MTDDKLFTEFPQVSTQEWEQAILKDLKGADYQKKLIWKTIEGFDVKPYYRASDLEGLEYLKTNPAQSPYTRGYKQKDNSWDIRQDFDTDCITSQNKMALQALDRGVNSLGFNAKNIETLEQMDLLLKDIRVDCIKVNFLKSKDFLKLLELYVQYLQSKGYDNKKAEGSINFDSYFFAMKHGGFYLSNEQNMDQAYKIMCYAKENLPLFKTITVNGKIFGNAGSNISQELGFSLAMANEYLYNMVDRGMNVDEVTSRMMFAFSTGSTYFMEIAKIRVARLLFAKVVEQYKGSTSEAEKIYIHTENQRYNKTIFDTYVNMLRTTTETMSSAIAGADSIAVVPFDVALKPSDDFSRRIATNQQILLKEESYLDKIVDPAAGSYYIETLTDNIAKKAWEWFKEIEKLGGFEKALRQNYPQDEIAKIEELRAKDISRRKTIIVGTNQYPNLTEQKVDIQEHKCCCGCGCKHEEQQEFKPLKCVRAAQPFEDLRLQVINSDKKPKVYNLLHGNLAMRNARSGFSTNFFGVAGYQIVSGVADDIAKGVEEALKENPDIIVLCSSDDEYPEFVKTALPLLKDKVQHIVVAGNPEDELKQEFNSLGITDYINVKTNVLESLLKYNHFLLFN